MTAPRDLQDLRRRVQSEIETELTHQRQVLAELGVTGMLELAPAGTLTKIAQRNLKGVELFTLNTPDQLEEAVYSSWQGDNSWNISRAAITSVGDCSVIYEAGQGYGRDRKSTRLNSSHT